MWFCLERDTIVKMEDGKWKMENYDGDFENMRF